MPTNLQLKKANFVRAEGYFYHMDIDGNTLYKKTDDGTNAFSYPLDTDITNTVQCLQYDGRYFYTLENLTTGNGGYGQLLIKRWGIQDYILRLVKTYTLDGASTQKYDSNAFAIENYSRTFASPATSGSTTITLNDNTRIIPGDILYMGPSSVTGNEGNYQERTVLQVNPGNQVLFTTPLTVNFALGDKVIYSNKCWFFNKYKQNEPVGGSSGQLYSFGLNTLLPSVTPMGAANVAYNDIVACMFIKDSFYGGSGREFLAYVKGTNILFKEVDPTNANYLSNPESAAQNNQETDTTVIPIYDITYEENTIFRLQQKATFRSGDTYTTEDWTPYYNYQLSTLSRLPASISLTAASGVISADGISSTPVEALVHDQFDQPINHRQVFFLDNDSTGTPPGSIYPTSQYTNSNGIATVTYSGGTVPKTVTITAST